MNYEFKFMRLPENHGFDEDHLKFLETIDRALVEAQNAISKKEDIEKIKKELDEKLAELRKDLKYEVIQKQLNEIFIKLEGTPIGGLTKEQLKEKERDLNIKWLRALLKKDENKMKVIYKEIKGLEPVMHTGVGSDDLDENFQQGGHFIPSLLAAEVNRFAIEGGVARREFRYLPFSGAGNSRNIPTLLTNVVVDWVEEGAKKSKTKPLIDKVTQSLKTLAAICILTEEIIEDAAIDLVSFVSQLLGEAIAAEEDNQFFSGDGNPWTGIINHPDVVIAPLAAGAGPLEMRPEALLAMTVAIPSTAAEGAKFYMHRTVWAAICSKRADAVTEGDQRGVFLVQEPTGTAPGTIWGYPVVLTDAMPSVSDVLDEDNKPIADQPFIIFGNLQKCCVYGDKQGLRVKVLDQASVTVQDSETPVVINLAERDMVALRVHKRVGYVCVLPQGICVLQTGPSS